MKKYVAEFIATYALVFFGTGAVVVDSITHGSISHIGVSLAFGVVVMAMIYTFGDVSGSHMNPAVTITFAIQKSFPTRLILPYILSQLLGALAASVTLKLLFPSTGTLGETIPAGSILQSLVLELVLSFFLMLTVLYVAQGGKEKGLFAGLAIGAVVFLEALIGGPISGASMNPARSIGPAIVSGRFDSLWIYCAAPVIGCLSALIIHQYIKHGKKEDTFRLR